MLKNMTALMSAFARAYHAQQDGKKVFDDHAAKEIIGGQDYAAMEGSLEKGAAFFGGSTIADCMRVLAPAPLERAAFCERALQVEARLGARQYLILGAGYDSFACRMPHWAEGLTVFEADREEVLEDKRLRIERAGLKSAARYIPLDLAARGWRDAVTGAGFDTSIKSFCSLLGVSYYIDKGELRALLDELSSPLCSGSALVLDHPDEHYFEGNNKNAVLATGAGEAMRRGYSYDEIEELLHDAGFLIYEYAEEAEAERSFFSKYNEEHPDSPLHAQPHVALALAVRK